jgi:hypothetical protein
MFFTKHLLDYSQKNNKAFFSRGHSDKIVLKNFETQDYITGHYGLTPVPYARKTFAILRDPVDRSFSYMKYIWQGHYSDKSIEDAFEFFLTDQKLQSALSNQHCKFLTSKIDVENYNKNIDDMKKHVESDWSLISKNIDRESVVKSIDENKIKILFFEDKDLHKKVFDIFELESTEHINFHEKRNSSITVDSKIYRKYYERICEINKNDIELYNFLKGCATDVNFQ